MFLSDWWERSWTALENYKTHRSSLVLVIERMKTGGDSLFTYFDIVDIRSYILSLFKKHEYENINKK